jgi:hypothetical protein
MTMVCVLVQGFVNTAAAVDWQLNKLMSRLFQAWANCPGLPWHCRSLVQDNLGVGRSDSRVLTFDLGSRLLYFVVVAQANDITPRRMLEAVFHLNFA